MSSDAYRIQERFAADRIAEGHQITGYKVGLTSKAMQEMAGVDEPDYGVLLDFLMREDGAALDTQRFIRPAVEIEIAFVMKDELRGPGVTAEDVIAATDHVLPAIEIVDFRLSLKNRRQGILDTVADLASCGAVIVGRTRLQLDQIDLGSVTGQLLKNGEVLEEGAASEVLGNPVNAIVWLANKLGEISDITFQPGHTILSRVLHQDRPRTIRRPLSRRIRFRPWRCGNLVPVTVDDSIEPRWLWANTKGSSSVVRVSAPTFFPDGPRQIPRSRRQHYEIAAGPREFS